MQYYVIAVFVRTHFRVLALSTVPLRFISRSRRLEETISSAVGLEWVGVCVCVLVCTSTPVVHVPEKLQVELVEGVVDLLPVALHQLCVVHQLLLRRTTRVKTHSVPFTHSIATESTSLFVSFSGVVLFPLQRKRKAVNEGHRRLTWLKRCGSTVSGRALVSPDSCETDREIVRKI